MKLSGSRLLFLVVQVIVGTTILSTAAVLLLDYFGVVETVKPFVVMSGSMEPAVKLGSVVVVRPQPTYSPGEIITYAPNGDKENPITHRIVFRRYPEGLGGEPVYLTAGDANEEFDRLEVRPKDIVGSVVLTLPYLGYIVSMAKQPYGFILLVIVPATIVIYEELKFVKRELASFLNTISERFFKKKFPTQLTSEDSELPKAAAFVPILGATLILASLTGSFFFDLETSLSNILGANESFSLVINEFVPDPDTTFSVEWVEIYNPTSSDIDLAGWSLEDLNGTNKSLGGLGVISSGGFKAYETGEGWLNNSGSETIKLLDPSSTVIDVHSYSGSSPDTSIGRENDASLPWKTCITPTKGLSNNGSC